MQACQLSWLRHALSLPPSVPCVSECSTWIQKVLEYKHLKGQLRLRVRYLTFLDQSSVELGLGAPCRKHLQKFKNLVANRGPSVLIGFRKDDVYMNMYSMLECTKSTRGL